MTETKIRKQGAIDCLKEHIKFAKTIPEEKFDQDIYDFIGKPGPKSECGCAMHHFVKKNQCSYDGRLVDYNEKYDYYVFGMKHHIEAVSMELDLDIPKRDTVKDFIKRAKFILKRIEKE